MSTKDDIAVLKLAKKKRVNTANMSPAQFAALALEAQGGLRAQAAAVTRAVKSRVKTEVLKQKVDADKINANAATCDKCPHGALTHLRDGTRACGACGCQGRFLESKWADPDEHCPLTVNGKQVKVVGLRADDPPTWTNVEISDANT